MCSLRHQHFQTPGLQRGMCEEVPSHFVTRLLSLSVCRPWCLLPGLLSTNDRSPRGHSDPGVWPEAWHWEASGPLKNPPVGNVPPGSRAALCRGMKGGCSEPLLTWWSPRMSVPLMPGFTAVTAQPRKVPLASQGAQRQPKGLVLVESLPGKQRVGAL